MATYKIKIEYENSSIFEIVEIKSENRRDAEKKCREFYNEKHALIESMSKKNIFTSKIIKSCSLVEPTIQESLQVWLEIEKIFKKSENDV